MPPVPKAKTRRQHNPTQLPCIFVGCWRWFRNKSGLTQHCRSIHSRNYTSQQRNHLNRDHLDGVGTSDHVSDSASSSHDRGGNNSSDAGVSAAPTHISDGDTCTPYAPPNPGLNAMLFVTDDYMFGHLDLGSSRFESPIQNFSIPGSPLPDLHIPGNSHAANTECLEDSDGVPMSPAPVPAHTRIHHPLINGMHLRSNRGS